MISIHVTQTLISKLNKKNANSHNLYLTWVSDQNVCYNTTQTIIKCDNWSLI